MNKKILLSLIVIFIAILIVLGIRLSSPEDTWICENGIWIKHGNPYTQVPPYDCE